MSERTVYLVDLKISKVEERPRGYVSYFSKYITPPEKNDSFGIYHNDGAEPEKTVVPVTDIHRSGRPDSYIAYSMDFDNFLKLPFNAIQNENILLKESIRSLTEKVQSLEESDAEWRRQENKFLAIPWWKRVWFSLWGKSIFRA